MTIQFTGVVKCDAKGCTNTLTLPGHTISVIEFEASNQGWTCRHHLAYVDGLEHLCPQHGSEMPSSPVSSAKPE